MVCPGAIKPRGIMENEETILDGVSSLDMRDAVAVQRFLGSIVEYAKGLDVKVKAGERNLSEKTEQVSRMADDMRAIRQRQAELEAAEAKAPNGQNAELLRFIDNDGSLFLKGVGEDDNLKNRTNPNMRRSRETGLLNTRPVNELHKQLVDDAEALYIATTVTHGADGFDARGNYRADVVKGMGIAYDRLQATWKAMPAPIRKAWDDQSGSGGEFIPTPLLSTPVWQVEEYDPDGLLDLFPEFQIGSASVELPVGTQYPVPYKGGGASGDNPAALSKSSVGTNKLTLALTSMYCMVLMHEDASADSIVAAVPFVREAIARSMTVGERFALINGDTAATHQDAIATWDLRGMFGAVDAGSIHYLRTLLGMRALAFDESNTIDRSTFTLATLAADINSVQGPRGNPIDVPIVTSYESYLSQFVNLSGIVSVSDYGDRRPIARGEVGNIFGHPIIQTDAMPADLATTGLYTGSGATSGALIFNRRMYRRLSRTGETITLAMQPDITIEGTYLRAKKRIGFKSLQKSGNAGVRLMKNLGA